MRTTGGTGVRLLALLVLLVVAMAPALPAGAETATVVPTAPTAPTVSDPYSELSQAEDGLEVVEAEAERLAQDLAVAQATLEEAESALEAATAERDAEAAALRRADDAVAAALEPVEEALARLNATTGQLVRLRELQGLAEDASATQLDSGRTALLTTVALDEVLTEDDPDDDTQIVDVLAQMAAGHAKRSGRIASLRAEFAHAQGEQASTLLDRIGAYDRAVQRRDERSAALDELEERVAAEDVAVQASADVVEMLAAVVAYNELSQAELESKVASLSDRIAAWRSAPSRATVPPELAEYGNGRVPPEALTPIGVGWHRLWGPAAEAFVALRAAAAADGIDIGVTDSYRTYASQVDLVERKGLYAEGGLAARPGFSDHGWGLALDLVLDAEALAWMRAYARDYGFVETTPREPWHWVFTAQLAPTDSRP